MQDRYAGDIGDFGKIGLLKDLQAQGLSVGVNWYRVDPIGIEMKADGSFKQEDGKYTIPKRFWECDKTLAEKLTKIAKSEQRSMTEFDNPDFTGTSGPDKNRRIIFARFKSDRGYRFIGIYAYPKRVENGYEYTRIATVFDTKRMKVIDMDGNT